MGRLLPADILPLEHQLLHKQRQEDTHRAVQNSVLPSRGDQLQGPGNQEPPSSDPGGGLQVFNSRPLQQAIGSIQGGQLQKRTPEP